jgi:hypothetical protein
MAKELWQMLYDVSEASQAPLDESYYVLRLSSIWGDDLLDDFQQALLDLPPDEARWGAFADGETQIEI